MESGGEKSSISTKYNGGEEEKNWNSENDEDMSLNGNKVADIEMNNLILKDGDLEETLTEGRDGEAIRREPSFGHVKTLDIPTNRGCLICKIKKLPYRAKHCVLCNRCVRKFDHHCFWVGGCVGELNHGKFWIFNFL